eukprot:910561-Rhodomonas_salina.1
MTTIPKQEEAEEGAEGVGEVEEVEEEDVSDEHAVDGDDDDAEELVGYEERHRVAPRENLEGGREADHQSQLRRRRTPRRRGRWWRLEQWWRKRRVGGAYRGDDHEAYFPVYRAR